MSFARHPDSDKNSLMIMLIIMSGPAINELLVTVQVLLRPIDRGLQVVRRSALVAQTGLRRVHHVAQKSFGALAVFG